MELEEGHEKHKDLSHMTPFQREQYESHQKIIKELKKEMTS